jgi:hypothetical protein
MSSPRWGTSIDSAGERANRSLPTHGLGPVRCFDLRAQETTAKEMKNKTAAMKTSDNIAATYAVQAGK